MISRTLPNFVVTITVIALLTQCSGPGAGPQAEGILGALSGREPSRASVPRHDVRHVRPQEESRGQLRWSMDF